MTYTYRLLRLLRLAQSRGDRVAVINLQIRLRHEMVR